ncbi:hypothetical protein [Streptomyces sp. NPDC089919]|uniref:hypothetical protein n=1 Tax=Streptomyces sp. NPDC089919 TaxID=3155188 RepID=UPI00342048B4
MAAQQVYAGVAGQAAGSDDLDAAFLKRYLPGLLLMGGFLLFQARRFKQRTKPVPKPVRWIVLGTGWLAVGFAALMVVVYVGARASA